jgi:hypothetical protein
LKIAIEIVDFPMKNGWISHSYVKLPEGTYGGFFQIYVLFKVGRDHDEP